MNTARKGDKAVVIRSHSTPEIIGRVVSVLGDPVHLAAVGRDGIKLPPAWRNETDIPPSEVGISHPYPWCFINTDWLIPIRDPDAEQRTETRKECAA